MLTVGVGVDRFIINPGDTVIAFQFRNPYTNKESDVVVNNGLMTSKTNSWTVQQPRLLT
jgi:hypothetical protein